MSAFNCSCGAVVASGGGDLTYVSVAGLRHERESCGPKCHCGVMSLALAERAILMDGNGAMAHSATECFLISAVSYQRSWEARS